MSETQDRDDSTVSISNQRRPVDPSSVDVAFELLSDHRRRQVVTWVGEADRPVTVGGLAAGIARYGGDRRRVRLELDQHHLPKLDDHGVVEYDRAGGTVSAGERLTGLLALVDAAFEERK